MAREEKALTEGLLSSSGSSSRHLTICAQKLFFFLFPSLFFIVVMRLRAVISATQINTLLTRRPRSPECRRPRERVRRRRPPKRHLRTRRTRSNPLLKLPSHPRQPQTNFRTVNYLKRIKTGSGSAAPPRSGSRFPAHLLEVGGPDMLSNLSHFISLAGSLKAATPPHPPPFPRVN